jgi:hypothetical protein
LKAGLRCEWALRGKLNLTVREKVLLWSDGQLLLLDQRCRDGSVKVVKLFLTSEWVIDRLLWEWGELWWWLIERNLPDLILYGSLELRLSQSLGLCGGNWCLFEK